jgi:hypothetical protein
LLKPLGIAPGYIGPESARLRGYKRAQFEEAFARYLPPKGDSNRADVQMPGNTGTSDDSKACSQGDDCTVAKCEKPNNDGLMHVCTVAKGGQKASAPSKGAAKGAPPPSNGDAMGLSIRTIGELALEYESRSYATYQETGTIESGSIDAWLRQQLAGMTIPERIEFEFKRVMDTVFAV